MENSIIPNFLNDFFLKKLIIHFVNVKIDPRLWYVHGVQRWTYASL
jgi:hypothetical protein